MKKRKSGTQVVLPSKLRQTVIKLGHDRPLAGHIGLEKTKERIITCFTGPICFAKFKNIARVAIYASEPPNNVRERKYP